MTARPSITPMMYVLDGEQCVGFVIRRGHGGYEATDQGGATIGFFRSEGAAANAVLDAANAGSAG